MANPVRVMGNVARPSTSGTTHALFLPQARKHPVIASVQRPLPPPEPIVLTPRLRFDHE
jgi:hypothetical protein